LPVGVGKNGNIGGMVNLFRNQNSNPPGC
jgi:hypothetical protein